MKPEKKQDESNRAIGIIAIAIRKIVIKIKVKLFSDINIDVLKCIIPADTKWGNHALQALCILTLMFGPFGLLAAYVCRSVGLLAVSLLVVGYSALLWSEALRRMAKDVKWMRALASTSRHSRRLLLAAFVLAIGVAPASALLFYAYTPLDVRASVFASIAVVIALMVLIKKSGKFDYKTPATPRYRLKGRDGGGDSGDADGAAA